MESDASVGQKPPFTLRQVVVSCAHLSILLRSVYVAVAERGEGGSPEPHQERPQQKNGHDDETARRFYLAMGAVILVIWALTAYQARDAEAQ
jgi:hypothetical protein